MEYGNRAGAVDAGKFRQIGRRVRGEPEKRKQCAKQPTREAFLRPLHACLERNEDRFHG